MLSLTLQNLTRYRPPQQLKQSDTIADRYAALGKTLHLRHLSQDCVAMLHKAGSLVEANVAEDPESTK